MRTKGRRFFLAVGFAALLALLTMGVVVAQGGLLGGKLLTGNQVTIPAGEVVDHDIYVFGGTLSSNGTVNGDIVAAGGTVDVNGPVNGDVLAAGGRVAVNGKVTGDVRVAGGQVSIAGDVTEDVAATGGQVSIAGNVGQDLLVSTGQLALSGTVAGSAIGAVGAYDKSGTIQGTDSITVTGNNQPTVVPPRANPVLDAIRHFIGVLVVAVVALWFAPRLLAAAESQVRRHPLPSLGWGVAAVLGYIIALVVIIIVMVLLALILGALGFDGLLAIVLFGGILLICALTLGFIVAAAFLADAIVGLALARFVAARSGRYVVASDTAPLARDRWSDIGLLAAGVAAVVVLTSLPVVGGWIKLVVVLLGLGALWLARGGPRFFVAAEVPRWSTPAATTQPPAAPPPAAPAG